MWAGKIMQQQPLEMSWISKLANSELSVDYLEKLTVSFHFIKVKPSLVKRKNNNNNTQYLIKELCSHYTVTWQKGCGKAQLCHFKNLPMTLHHQILQKEKTTDLRKACIVSPTSAFKMTKHSIKTFSYQKTLRL